MSTDTRAVAERMRAAGITTLADLLNLFVVDEHGRQEDCVPADDGERSRWYFDRELRVGRRVIFAWREAVRHPDWYTPEAIARSTAEMLASGCEPDGFDGSDGQRVQVAGVEFPSAGVAARFDLEALERGRVVTHGFASWEAAEAWLWGAA